PWLEVGASYRGSFVLQIDQAFAIHGDLGSADSPIVQDASFSLRSMSLDLFQPLELTAGFAAHLRPDLLVSGDVTYASWSDYENPSALITIAYDFKHLTRFVKIGDAPPLEPAHFHDTVIPRLGVEWQATPRLAVRGGYSFEPTPAPEQRGPTHFLDNHKHTPFAGPGRGHVSAPALLPPPPRPRPDL